MSEEFTHIEPPREELSEVIALLEYLGELADDDDIEPADVPEEEVAAGYARTRSRLGLPPELADRASVAAVLIKEVEAWLAQVSVQAAEALAEVVEMPPLDFDVPALTAAGYAPGIEINASIDGAVRTAEIVVMLTPVSTNPSPMTVTITSSDGTRRSADVNSFGLAEVKGVPITEDSPADLKIQLKPQTT
ncbi:hypothetical protein ABZS68_38600 [Streptomyces sp. NPDC005571]|uniref:hypothetical protein n=1 Tax=Streptomyces sp. NPDC005571 TaxID=3156888 RepID=UPI0033A3B313